MIRKANYKPTLPIFGERLLEGKARSVRFEEEHDSHQYDSLYDDNMKEYLHRPNIKKRLVEIGLTDNNGNPITNKERERNVMKKKQLLKEREELVKKIRIREGDRIARLAAASDKVTKSCVACDTHNRILSYLSNHMCPIHSNATYQRAKETLKDSVTHDVHVSSNEDNLAKLETENKTLKNLWYSEVLRMEEDALQQQLKSEKRRLQQVLLELKKLKQRKEAIDMESLEEIKINLYSKIKRRLGLQALLTTLREVEGGVTAALYDKVGHDDDDDVDSSDTYDWSLPPQLNRVGLSFQYLPPPPQAPVISSGYHQYVNRPSSAPVRSQQVMNNSELSLHQPSFQYDEQLKKRPSSSRGYRTDNRGPYSRTTSGPKQTANISPLVNSTSALTGVPQQFSNTIKSNSNLVNEPLVNKEDVDDDTMPLDELEGLSDIEISSSLQRSASEEPVTIRDKLQRHRQAYSVMSESALNHRPSIPVQRSTPTNLSKKPSEKKVNFIDPVPQSTSGSEIGNGLTKNTKEQNEPTSEQYGATQYDEAASVEHNLKDAKSAEIVDDANENNYADLTEESNLNSMSDLRNTAQYEKADKTVDNQSTHSLPQTAASHHANSSTNTIPKEMEDSDPIVNGQLLDEAAIPSHLSLQTESQPTTNTPMIIVEDVDSVPEQVLIDAAPANKLAIRSSIVPGKSGKAAAQAKNLKRTSSKKINAKTSRMFDSTQAKNLKRTSSKMLNAKTSRMFDSKTASKSKQGVKQTSKKPKKINQDWKKTILQTMKK